MLESLTPAERQQYEIEYAAFLDEHGPDAGGETCDFADYLAGALWLRGESVMVPVAVEADIPL